MRTRHLTVALALMVTLSPKLTLVALLPLPLLAFAVQQPCTRLGQLRRQHGVPRVAARTPDREAEPEACQRVELRAVDNAERDLFIAQTDGALFERFMDPERNEMPDIDIDICQAHRQELIEYVRQKYGQVAQIITFGTMKARAAVEFFQILHEGLATLDRFNAEIDRLTLPVLLLHGSGDPFVPPYDSVEALLRMPSEDKEMRIFPGARHELVHETNKREVIDVLHRWIIRVT